MKVSDVLVKALEDQGVEYVFGVPGEENADFMQSLHKSEKITFILTHDESAAGFMALAYAQVKGTPAAVVATLGPGVTNLATSLAQATQDGAPLIAIVGQGSTMRLERDSHQIINQVEFLTPITKRVTPIRVPSVVYKQVEIAVKESLSGKAGAVVLELPEDVAKEEAVVRPCVKPTKRYQEIDEGLIRQAAKLVRDAEKPLVLIGAGVHRERVTEETRNLINRLNLRTVNTFQGKGVFGNNTVGFMDGHNLELVDESDVVIAIGYGQVECAAEKLRLPERGRKIIHICIEKHSFDPIYSPDIDLVGNMSDIIYRLTEEI